MTELTIQLPDALYDTIEVLILEKEGKKRSKDDDLDVDTEDFEQFISEACEDYLRKFLEPAAIDSYYWLKHQETNPHDSKNSSDTTTEDVINLLHTMSADENKEN